jgi:hypothetical protein
MLSKLKGLFKKNTSDCDHRISLNGVSACVSKVYSFGETIDVYGWYDKHWEFKEGQRILFVRPDGSGTRYQILTIHHPGDPADMYFMKCSFDPRPTPKE